MIFFGRDCAKKLVTQHQVASSPPVDQLEKLEGGYETSIPIKHRLPDSQLKQ